MPDLGFEVVGVETTASVTPLLHFKIRITNSPAEEILQTLLLSAQIQIQPAQRSYTARETENLRDLFGPPEVWGQTLRNRLWAHANTIVGPFSGSTAATLAVPCTADLNVGAAKYFYALEAGDISLLFLFSGSVFYLADGRLQFAPVSWNHEATYHIPAQTWHELMTKHYPNAWWLELRRDVFDRLHSYKSRHSLLTWDEAIEHLLERRAQPKSAEPGTLEKEEAIL